MHSQQLVNDFKQIIDTVSKDVTAMNAKRDISNLPGSAEDTLLRKRQECLDVTDIEKCIADLGEIVDDPSEILGSRKRDIVSDITSKGPVRRRQESPVYNEVEQSQVCNAFRGVSLATCLVPWPFRTNPLIVRPSPPGPLEDCDWQARSLELDSFHPAHRFCPSQSRGWR